MLPLLHSQKKKKYKNALDLRPTRGNEIRFLRGRKNPDPSCLVWGTRETSGNEDFLANHIFTP